MIDLGTLGGSSVSQATGVNDNGEVIGTSGNLAFRWTASSGMVSLGTLGGPTSSPDAINNLGDIAGMTTLGNGLAVPFLWTPSGGMVSLGTLPGSSSCSLVTGMNDSDMVIGYCGVGANDSLESFEWAPVTGMQEITPPGPADTPSGSYEAIAEAINQSGEVAGGGNDGAFMWTEANGYSLLPLSNGWANARTW
jgi:probable HAF family extracellular repeat protein